MIALDLLRTFGAWALVGLLPGLLVARGLRPSAGWLRNLVIAPLLTLGMLMGIAVPLTYLGLPVRPGTTLAPALIIGVLCLVAGLVREGGGRASAAVRVSARAWVWLAGVVAVSLAIWLTVSGGLALVPPNDDGSNHGLFATQVLLLETVQPDRIVVGDVITGQPSSPYYPLALHLVAALMMKVASVPVGAALTVQMVMGAAVLLPLGTAVLTRRLYPHRPSAASVAALFAVMFAIMPYYVSTWGGFPFILGMALLPIAVDGLAGTGRDAGWLGSGLIAGGVLVGLFALHSSEMIAAGLLAAALVIGATVRREVTVRAWALPAVIGALLALAFIGAQAYEVLAGSGNVAVAALQGPYALPAALASTVAFMADMPNPQLVAYRPDALVYLHALSLVSVVALIGVGVAVSLVRRWSREWIVTLVVVMVIAVLSALRLVDTVTVPWYSRFDRFGMNLLPLVATIAGLGAATIGARMQRHHARLAVAGAVAVAVALPQLAVSAQVADSAFADGSLAGPDQRAAFAYMASGLRPGERVLNDAADGSGWMWALSGAPPLFAVAPHQIDGWGDRLLLLKRARYVSTAPRVRAVADQWSVRYAYIGPQTYRGRRPALNMTQMLRYGGWRIAFHQGGAVVLERTALAG